MDDILMNKNYKGGGVKGTSWNGIGGVNGYVLRFETDDEELYKYMTKAAQRCIDKARKKKKKEE